MVQPIDGAASLIQAQNVQELLASAQREVALAQLRHMSDTERTRELDQATINKEEEAQGKTIRDDDPRQGRKRQSREDMPERNDEDPPPQHIDIVV
jgi:hypothetical protein